MHESKVHVYAMDHPGDTAGLRRLIDSGEVDPAEIEGIMITHEGDLSGNALALREVGVVLAEKTGMSRDEVIDTIPIQAMAGACGFMTPHVAVFTRRPVPAEPNGQKRFVVAGACTRRFEPREVGTLEMIHAVRETVESLMTKADIESPADVPLVFAKAPWPNPELYRAKGLANDLVSDDWWEAGAYARGGAALGIGLALRQIDENDLTPDRIQHDDQLYSTTAHCSSTEDRTSVALLLFGNSAEAASDTMIGSGVLEDGMDAPGVLDILRGLGIGSNGFPDSGEQSRVRYGWLKPKTAEAGTLRGQRHNLMTHSVLGSFWWMVEKAPVHAMVASILGTPVLEVATGAEHQGPPGHPLLAVLAEAH